MKRHIVYIINPVSGSRRRSGLERQVEEASAAAGVRCTIFPSVASGDYSFLRPIIRDEKVTDVVIAGGDGTISQVVGSLLREDVNFGIIPCGSGNGLAYTARIPQNPKKALDIIFSQRATKVDGFVINGRFSCMLSGLGFDAKVAHEFATKQNRGLKTYAVLVAKNFLRARSYKFIIEANGTRFSTEAFFISIANSNQFGNNFRIAPRALLSDGLLDIVIVKKAAKPLLLYNVMRQVLAGRLRNMVSSLRLPVIYFQTNELRILNRSHAPLHIDGDPTDTPDMLEVRMMPKCFRLIHPL